MGGEGAGENQRRYRVMSLFSYRTVISKLADAAQEQDFQVTVDNCEKHRLDAWC